MAASSPLAASPGRTTGQHTAVNTGGQVTMAVNTPTTATPALQGTTTADIQSEEKSIPNVFDPSHIPTLYRRIQSLSQLLINASNDPNSLSIPRQQTQQMNENIEASLDNNNALSSSRNGPDIVMGATTEDDVTSGYEAALALSMESGREKENSKGTELAFQIVKESQGLRDAFQRAREAIDGMEGGEMDIDEQEKLLDLLEDYIQAQR